MTLSIEIGRVTCSVLTVIVLVIAFSSALLTSRLPVRFVTEEWPVNVDFASGASFNVTLPHLLKGWQNLQVAVEVHNKEWREHGIVFQKPMMTRVRAQQTELAGGEVDDWTILDNKWSLQCPQGKPTCDRANIAYFNGLPYTEMHLEFKLMADDTNSVGLTRHHAETFMGDIIISTSHETVSCHQTIAHGRSAGLALKVLVLRAGGLQSL